MHKLYEQNALKAVDERHSLLRHKTRLLMHDIDNVHVVLFAFTRVALHDGRSEARNIFYKLFAVFLILLDMSMDLAYPGALPPVLGAGQRDDYFAVEMKLKAPTTGDITASDSLESSSTTNLPPTTHPVQRTVCLYETAMHIIQGLVVQPFAFSSTVLDAAAKNLRGIVSSTDREWSTQLMKQAESVVGGYSWGLMLPMFDSRKTMNKDIRTFLAVEKHLVVAGDAAGESGGWGGSGSTGPSGAAGGSLGGGDTGQPSWL